MQYSERDHVGYPWLFFHPTNQWKVVLCVSSLILVGSVGFFLWCISVSNDTGGDSFAGLVFAIASTVFMFLAAVSFSLRRRARQRSVGQLNAFLNWHICFGIIALVMVFLHAFGNYNPRTGTYALYGMIALVISGFIGRALDRVMPRLISLQVRRALTAQGEDRVEQIWGELQSTGSRNRQKSGIFSGWRSRSSAPELASNSMVADRQDSMAGGWDMAYVTLDKAAQKGGRSTYRLPELQRSSGRVATSTLYPAAQQHIGALEDVQQALKQEAMYRYVIRLWRVFHIVLAVVTVGLTLWHIEYALSLVIPALQKYGFGYLLPWP